MRQVVNEQMLSLRHREDDARHCLEGSKLTITKLGKVVVVESSRHFGWTHLVLQLQRAESSQQ